MNQISQTKPVSQANEDRAHLDIARRFYSALVGRDWGAMRALLTDDARWTLPGKNAISGTANGADAVVDRARKISSYGLKLELLQVLVSSDSVALSLHNTARQGDRVLDEYLASVCQFKNSKIVAIETFLVTTQAGNERMRVSSDSTTLFGNNWPFFCLTNSSNPLTSYPTLSSYP